MRTWYFTEDAYPYLPDAETYESIRVDLPNRHFDPDKGADLYHMRCGPHLIFFMIPD